MTEQEQAETKRATKQATVSVIFLAVIVLYTLMASDSDMRGLVGFVGVVCGGYLLIQFRYSVPLFIAELVIFFGGLALLMGGK